MFYCKYCRKEREDREAGIHFKKSIKCWKCVSNGTNLKDQPKKVCECGVTYTDSNDTTKKAHLKSKFHNNFINSLVKEIKEI
jgi:hypothetical protein